MKNMKAKPNVVSRIVACAVFCLCVCGCGNGWEMTKKNWKSNLSDLPRCVKVYDSFTKEVLWEHTGSMFMSSDLTPGNVSIIYRGKNNRLLKNDFVGQHVQVVLFEIP